MKTLYILSILISLLFLLEIHATESPLRIKAKYASPQTSIVKGQEELGLIGNRSPKRNHRTLRHTDLAHLADRLKELDIHDQEPAWKRARLVPENDDKNDWITVEHKTSSFNPGRLSAISVRWRDRPLGSGSYGTVRLGQSKKTHQWVAVKELDLRALAHRDNLDEDSVIAAAEDEAELCRELRHKNILQCSPYFEVQRPWHKAYIVTEYCAKGDLYQIVKSKALSMQESHCYFWQLMNGLTYLHNNMVVHRDIKPENIMVHTTGLLKIGDWGFAEKIKSGFELFGLTGTESYMAPEMFEMEERRDWMSKRINRNVWTPKLSSSYDPFAADVWAAAITYLRIRMRWSGLWDKANQSDGRFKDFIARPRQYLKNMRSPDAPPLQDSEIELLLSMLDKDPTTRMSAKDVKSDSWFATLALECPTRLR